MKIILIPDNTIGYFLDFLHFSSLDPVFLFFLFVVGILLLFIWEILLLITNYITQYNCSVAFVVIQFVFHILAFISGPLH